MCVSGTATAPEFEMEEYVRGWYGHRTRVFRMEEYVREWYGHLTRVFATLTMCP